MKKKSRRREKNNKGKRREYHIRTAFVGHESVDPKDRSDPAHALFGESFEDHCGEGFHVNSR